MTDEEKAEEYAEKLTYIIKGRTLLSRSEANQRYTGIVQGVLYGLAESRKEKWHKIADGDYPNPNTAVLICFNFEKWTSTYIAYYRPAIKKWQMYNLLEAQRQPIVDDYIDSEEVIAWCELPKFEE